MGIKFLKVILMAIAATLVFALPISSLKAQSSLYDTITSNQKKVSIVNAKKLNNTTFEIKFSNQQKMLLDFYGNNTFRMFQDNSGLEMRAPQAKPEAKILVENSRKAVTDLTLVNSRKNVTLSTTNIQIVFDKNTTTFTVENLITNQIVIKSIAPIAYEKNSVSIRLSERGDEYFFGGGVQNGRFTHKGKAIAIENQNSWTDGGVASPTPYYWSTKGYGFMSYTFKKGIYDFGSKEENTVILSHETDYLDVFFMVSDGAIALLNDFYQLTGNPVLIPKFGFYEGHLNAYNRDYWKEDSRGILFEDGKRYKESQKDKTGIKESLNGENDNYQFSARAVIDRYKAHDMPFGWILPNDGYGAGYGQTSSLDGNIQNLKDFGDYARENGVQIGLWTQSDLHPIDSIEPLLQRDLEKEVGVAGVRVLKTDVAWVGAGYSFGLNGVQDAAEIMHEFGITSRPFIISLDGWAGTQRYATIWSGDQTGGVWEYIRFHIPTYIGSGLSGQPNITSDMDGIFGGENSAVNIRDFQWKVFTPMQLNMDGWGYNEKYPHALGEPATSINRNYLKLKSELLPYSYSIARESIDGLPMIRAMFLEEQNDYTLSKNTQYQYMFGPYFLVAPIYQDTKADTLGNDIRNHIYLPKGSWVDYFSGQTYEGGKVINNVECPIWKLPVFVKNGAIIPMANPNNNITEINNNLRTYEIYPFGKSSFTDYDDDGSTTAYMLGEFTETVVESKVEDENVMITVFATTGNFNGFVKDKTTFFKINVTEMPKKLKVKVGNKTIRLKESKNLSEFKSGENVYFYNQAPDFNQFPTKGSDFEKVEIRKNPQLMVKIGQTDVSKNDISLQINGFEFNTLYSLLKNTGSLSTLNNVNVVDSNVTAYTLKPNWDKLDNADYYEIVFDEIIYSTIKDTELLFENLTPDTDYNFRARAVNSSGMSAWTDFTATTKSDPLEFAIKGITATATCKMQGSQSLAKFFDFDESTNIHTKYYEKAVPFDIVIDLKSVNYLDKIVYLPRKSGRNGMIEKAKFFYSNDKENWEELGSVEWKTNPDNKTFVIENQAKARYIKMSVEKASGDYGSGRELYVFKVPGTESYIPGDINNDQIIDNNDLTSYMNYTGLRAGDADFDGYVSKGDVNKNDLIDAYDISNVTTQIEGGVSDSIAERVSGKLMMTTAKKSYKAGDIVEIKVMGQDLKSVNALSFALPYNDADFDYVGLQPEKILNMQNLTYDRLHTNGEKVLYPTFVNLGNQPALEDSETLFIIQFKAKRAIKLYLELKHGILVDKNLFTEEF